MKKLMNIILILSLLTLYSCSNTGAGGSAEQGTPSSQSEGGEQILDGRVSMIARIDKISDKIGVTVLEREYTFGEHLVITPSATCYISSDGTSISRSDLKIGDKVEILYSGQVMLSLPPQIVAAKITVLE